MKNKGAIFVFISAVFYSLGGLLFKYITWNAIAINGARSFLALVFLLVFLVIKKHKFKINLTIIFAAIAGSLTCILFSVANKMTSAGNVIVLQFTMPIFVIIFSYLLYKKKPSKLEIITCCVVFVGITLFFIDSISSGDSMGNVLAILSGVSYSFVFLLNSKEEADPFSSIIYAYILSSIIAIPSLLNTDIKGSSPSLLVAVLVLGIVQQGLAQVFFALGIKDTPVVTSSLLSCIEPILNPLLVAVFYNELLSPMSFVAALLVIVAIASYSIISAKMLEKKG